MQGLETHFAQPAMPRPAAALMPPSQSAVTASQAGDIEGVLNAYKRSEGFGFSQTRAGETYFIHVNAVIDDRLREELNHVPYSEFAYQVEIPVVFQDGGYTKNGAKYRAAKNIRLRQGFVSGAVAAD